MSGYMAGARLAEELSKTEIVRRVSSGLASTATGAAVTLATGNPALGTAAGYAVTGAKIVEPTVVEEVAAAVGGVVAATAIGMVGSIVLPFVILGSIIDEL